MPDNPATVGPYRCGSGEPLLVIAGPCVLETPELALHIAERLVQIAAALPIQLVFKASFDQANRTSLESYRGPGLQAGLEILARVKPPKPVCRSRPTFMNRIRRRPWARFAT